MDILSQIKADSIRLRKAKDPLAPFSTFVISEIMALGKIGQTRETNDHDAVRVLKKLRGTTEENMNIRATVEGLRELEFLNRYLPSMVSEQEVRDFLDTIEVEGKGPIMKAVKEHFGVRVDMKMVGSMVS
ncbi:MAG: hypothetical protein WCY93_11235 [Anaerolineaceae bacterium]